MVTAVIILGIASAGLAVVIGCLFGPKAVWSCRFRVAGRETRLALSGYDLAVVVLVAGLLAGLLAPPVVTSCVGLRRPPDESALP